MSLNNHNSQRSERLAKRRKTNTILNTLIGIVIVLIIIVSYRIFFAADGAPVDEKEISEDVKKNDQKENEVGIKDTDEENENDANKDDEQNSEDASKEEKEDESEDEVIVEKSDENNVEETIVDPKWEAVGTEQANHQYSTAMDSVDWKEKERALSYATDISVDNMVIWWLERGPEGDHQAIGTISPTDDQSKVYRVHLEWEDGKGWKPTIVKKLIQNDKRQ